MMRCSPILVMRVSQEQLRAMYERNPTLARLNSGYIGCSGSGAAPMLVKPNKYRNVKVEYEGMKFDSKHELECWKKLQLRERAGEIEELYRQVPYDLVVEGQKIGRLKLDFAWVEKGQTVVADAKSPATRKETAYRLRKRIFEALYAPLVIREL